MKASDTAFAELDGVEGVYVAHSGKLSCSAIRLTGGGVCLYSPVAGLAETQGPRLEELGGVSALLAPNHYHNKGLSEHVARFPNAGLYCSRSAEPRLRKITGLKFQSLDTLGAELPGHIRILEPAGLKTGEVWLEVDQPDETVWIVTDAFSSERAPKGQLAENPAMLGTFPRYGVKDAATYRKWLERRLSDNQPTILVPCHGSPVKRSDLGASLIRLVDEAF